MYVQLSVLINPTQVQVLIHYKFAFSSEYAYLQYFLNIAPDSPYFNIIDGYY